MSADVTSVGSIVPTAIGRVLTPAEVAQIPDASSGPASSLIAPQAGSAVAAPYTPAQIRHFYGVDQLGQDGTGQTIGIIDAYDQSAATVTSELSAFDTRFGLPAANLTVVTPTTQNGASPALNAGWDLEISLDVEWAHVIAPGAKIILVEAAEPEIGTSSTPNTTLTQGIATAISMGATQVSMSWGGGEFSGESSYDTGLFNSPGVSFFASTGDSASEVLWPAVSPYVTSVGGTTISLDASGNKISETTWSSGGGGPSSMEAQPSFQTGFLSSTNRTTPDVAYNADPNSGIYVDDNGTYEQVGGTSAGAPQWAGLAALANEGLVAAGKPTLGTGQTFGTNSVLYTLAGGSSYTNPNGDFSDITTGSNGHPATTGYDLATGLGSPVANKLVPDLIATGTTPPSTTPTVGDAGFEAIPIGTGYAYNPTGSSWTFSGSSPSGSGVAGNNSAFTYANPAAPQGTQVAFLQEKGTITQSVAGWAAGSYTLSFDAAQRAANNTTGEDFEILIDGNVVGTFKPSATSYQLYTTGAFTVSAGSHVIQFLGLDSAGGDNTAFLDAVSVALATPPSTTPTVGDAGFEAIPIGTGYAYNPAGSSWTFSGSSPSGSGVAGNNSAFTYANPAAPQGTQVAFLQEKGTITQSVAGWAAGSYTLSFDAAQRAANNTTGEDFEVLIDGNVVGTFKPSATSYQLYTTGAFTVSAGSHVIQFLGLDSAGGDNTAFLDAVSVALATPPSTTPTVGDAGFEAIPIGTGYAYNPTGSSWTFSGSSPSGSGVAGNNSAFTYANPAAPQGTQVAFLQEKGTITQSVAGWAAGSYTLSFDAAQRAANNTTGEDFEVLIDQVVVATFQPTTTSYQPYMTSVFKVSAGSHVIQFLGLDSAGGDNTVFLDGVSVANASQ